MFRWSFKHKPYKPLSFSSAELALCVLPSLYTTHYLKQRFISVYRPMLGQSAVPALDVKSRQGVSYSLLTNTHCRLFYIKNSKNESLPPHREFISVYVYPSLKFFTLHFHWILHSSLFTLRVPLLLAIRWHQETSFP